LIGPALVLLTPVGCSVDGDSGPQAGQVADDLSVLGLMGVAAAPAIAQRLALQPT